MQKAEHSLTPKSNANLGKLTAYARIIHPSTDRVLLEYSRTISNDRFGEDIDETDTRPGLTRFVLLVVEDLLALTRENGVLLPVPPRRTSPIPSVRENPLAVVDHAYNGPTLGEHLRMEP